VEEVSRHSRQHRHPARAVRVVTLDKAAIAVAGVVESIPVRKATARVKAVAAVTVR
jgi:hypothetical protein